MKNVFIICLCLGILNMSIAQDPTSIINVELDTNGKFFADAGTVPHGQKIQLKGKGGETDFKKVEIEISTFNGKHTTTAKISSDEWTADIGPFQPRQLITLTVKAVSKKINTAVLNPTFENAFKVTFEEINKEFERSSNGIPAATLRTLFFKALKTNLEDKVDNFFVDENQKIIDNLPIVIDTNCLFQGNDCIGNGLLSILSNIQSADKAIKKFNDTISVLKISQQMLKKDSTTIAIKIDSLNREKTKNGISQSKANKIAKLLVTIQSEKVKKDSLLKVNNNLISKIVIELTASESQRTTGKKNLDAYLKSMPDKIKWNIITTTLPVSSVDLKATGVEYYAGFDVSAITFDTELGATALYFTVSPYLFGKFDPELDFSDVRKKLPPKGNPMRGKIISQNFCSWVKYHISPTVGIAFSGNADVPSSPQLFAGGSLRINRIFKITVGSVFYRNTNYFVKSTGVVSTSPNSSPGRKYLYNFGMGLSLNLSYFGTVMQMLGNATRSVKNDN